MENQNEIEKLKKQIEELKANMPLSTNSTPNKEELNQEEQDIYSWEAPVRIFVKWDTQKIVTVLLILAFLSLILVYLREPTLLFVSILLGFVSISLTIFPPAKTVHKITNKGIFSLNRLYLWEDLKDFWLAEKKGSIVMYVDTTLNYPSRLLFIIPPIHVKNVVSTLSKYIKYYEMREDQGSLSKINDGLYVKYNDIKNLQ